jgi:geranylgeranyl pyrophosphate synthase
MTGIPLPTSLDDELDRIDEIIAGRIRLRPEVEQIAAPHALRPRTDRTRGALVILCARLGSYDRDATAHAAAAVELIQAATLLHDDLIDPAAVSHEYSASDGWHQNVALMVGEYLFALAASEMALAPDPRIIAYYSQSVMAICEGQLAPVRVTTPYEAARRQYDYMVDRKMATLFQAACQAGGVCGAVPEHVRVALGRYGHALGMALALRADALDYRTGAARALQLGAITLPLIYAVEAGGLQPDMLVHNWPASQAQRAQVLEIVREVGGDVRALHEASRYAERALDESVHLPPSPARDDLYAIAYGCGHMRKR